MKTQSKVGCGDLIKTTALLLGFLAVFGGIIFVIVSIFGYIENGWVPGVICMLSGWVGGLTLFGFGIIVDAHEGKATPENASAESAASTTSVRPVFKKEGWVCPKCSAIHPNHIGSCQNCGEPKPSSSATPARLSQAPATVSKVGNTSPATVKKVVSASNSTPKKTKDGWTCPKCSAIHPSHIGSCQNCGEPKPSGSTASASSSQTSATVSKVGNAPNSAPKKTKDSWVCPKCSAIHPNHIGSCQNCGEPKPSGSTAPARSSQDPATVGWRCSRCGNENSKYVSNCMKCGTAKPQA